MSGRRMRFTVNNWTEETKEKLLKEERFTYVVIGEELAPTTGTPHLQGYAEFATLSKFGVFAKKYSMACFKCDASAESNIEYCKKDGIFTERGTPKGGHKAGGEATKKVFEDAFEIAKTGKLEDIPEPLRTRYWSTYQKVAKQFMPRMPDLDTLDNYWITGPAGIGKSRKAREMAGDSFYPKALNKWWDGYMNEDWVIIDDYELDCKLEHHLKIWSDRYDFIAESKGGALRIRPKHIIVTSNYTINDCFIEKNLNEAISRRFKVINME